MTDKIAVSARRLRIGFVGNTNNYPFMVAMALRDMGHDVTMLLDRAEALHRPHGRYVDLDPAQARWVRDISGQVASDGWRLSASAELTSHALREYDLLVLNGMGPALAGGHGVPSFAMLTGSDLTNLANWSSIPVLWRALAPVLRPSRRVVACALHARTVYRQRRAIQRSFGFSYFVRGVVAEADRVLDGMGLDPGRRIGFMLSDVDRIAPRPLPVRGHGTLRVFNVARLNWRQPKPDHLSEMDMKGTDILLAGFAEFVKRTRSDSRLVLVRKGVDIDATEKEVDRLGLVGHVVWLDEMSQAEVFEQYALADVVTEQLSTSYVGMGGLDAMAAGRPVIANTRPDARGDGLLQTDSPVLHADTSEDICRHLSLLARSRETVLDLGRRSRQYVEERHSPRTAARRILALYAATSGTPTEAA